jgi:PBP1b-binding outer membrane lipoprotein LpoB
MNGCNMKQMKLLALVTLITLALNGCMASSTSPKGINCIPGTPFQDLPEGCIGL